MPKVRFVYDCLNLFDNLRRIQLEPTIALYDQGLEEYSWSVVIRENLALAVWILLGTLISLQFNGFLGWGYLGFALLMILIIQRKLVCTRCYYYGKRCHVGWGYLSKALFKKGDIEEFRSCVGIKLAPIFFGIIAVVPVALGLILMIRKFSLYTLILFLIMVSAILYSSIIARKSSCARCKMRMQCPGGAVKTSK